MNKKILRLAIPNILSNLSIPLLSSVDTAVVGHLDEVYYLGAIAIGSMIFNFVYWGFGFLRMGTTGLTAQAFGGKNKSEINLVLFRALGVSITSALFILLIQIPLKEFSFFLVSAGENVEYYAASYFDIRIWAAPATLSLYAFQGWLLGMQNAKYPLIITLFANALNIIFNLYFVYALNMNSDGVAYGTVIAQYAALILTIVLIRKKYPSAFRFPKMKMIIDLAPMKKFFRVNFDIFIRTLCLIFTFSYFTVISAEFGDALLAANTILLQLWMILSYGVDGFAFAAESLTGKYIGARNSDKLKLTVKYSFAWGLGIGAVLSIVYLIFSDNIISLFTNNHLVIESAGLYIIWTVLAPLINSAAFIWDGIYIGATATKAMRNSMIAATFLIYLPIYHFTASIWGNHSIWVALLLFMLFRGLSLTILSKKVIFSRITS